jgi:hypothetical protein
VLTYVEADVPDIRCIIHLAFDASVDEIAADRQRLSTMQGATSAIDAGGVALATSAAFEVAVLVVDGTGRITITG